MSNIKKLRDTIKDEPNYSTLGLATGILGNSIKESDINRTNTYDPRKYNLIMGQSRNLTRRPPIVVVVLKDDYEL